MGATDTLITPPGLIAALGSSTGLAILDVRRAPIFQSADDVIASASWRDPAQIEDWSNELSGDHDYIVYCVHGHEVSQNTAAALRANGVRARYLEGGIDAYRETGGAMTKRGSDGK
jgi:Fe-Mn family superoxide dismutase